MIFPQSPADPSQTPGRQPLAVLRREAMQGGVPSWIWLGVWTNQVDLAPPSTDRVIRQNHMMKHECIYIYIYIHNYIYIKETYIIYIYIYGLYLDYIILVYKVFRNMMLTEHNRENSIPTGDEPLGEAWSHPPDEAKAEGLPSSGRVEKTDVFVWGGEIHGKNYEQLWKTLWQTKKHSFGVMCCFFSQLYGNYHGSWCFQC